MREPTVTSLSAPAEGRSALVPYEQRLAQDWSFALSEGSRFFEQRGAVQEALRKIAERLAELGVPYAVAGGMALFRHGFRRFTEDVDLLVTREGLNRIHEALDGRGYLPPFAGSKHLRDTDLGVRIEFLVTGGFPGDGKPKPVAFPDPEAVGVELDGVRYLNLPTLVELKIASGMTNSQRIKDLADVQELIKLLDLPLEFEDQLQLYVRAKYRELWRSAKPAPKRYLRLWRAPSFAAEAATLEKMAASLEEAAATLRAMLADGVTLEPRGGAVENGVHLATTDPDVARKYDMHEESEFLE